MDNQNYQPGDIVNGHVLTPNDGWQPVQPMQPSPKKPMSTGKKVLIGAGAFIGGIILLGAIFGEDPAPTSVAEPTQATASETPTPTPTPDSASEAEATPTPEVVESETPEPEPEPSAVETPGAEYGGYPKDQARFVTTIDEARDKIESADNDLKESAALRARDRELAKIAGTGLEVDGWVGTIRDMGANGEGKGYVEIEIAPNARVLTWNNAFSDIGDNTLIPENSAMFDSLLSMNEGDAVVFSGRFLHGDDTALRQGNLTEMFYGIDPQFIFKFSSIKAA